MPDLTGTLSELFIYPIKSCAGVPLQQASMTPLGLQFDRQWLIVDTEGQFQTQREIPHLIWIEPYPSGHTLRLSAPDMPTIELPFATPTSTKRKVRVWADTLDALDMGQTAADWLDDYLQIPNRHFRLIQFDSNATRLSDGFWCGQQRAPLQFADGFAVNVLSRASLRHFNEKLMEAGIDPVDASRFRPNLLVDGLDVHEEDLLHTVRFVTNGVPLLLEFVKHCPRCQIPNINPLTATAEPEISAMLSRYRQLPAMDNAICFAMNAVVRTPETVVLSVNDQFEGNYRFEG